jgi:carboxypeptidase T
MAKFRVTISGKTYEAMADLVRVYRVGIAGHTAKKLAKGGYRVHALMDGADIRTLEKAGYKIKRHEDVIKAGKKRQAEVTKARRPSKRAVAPAVLTVAEAGQYLNVDDIESALAAAAAPPHNAFTQLIALPNKTWEGRECHAIKIANGSGAQRPGIYFLGGVHAREWGSPDILINFVQQLTAAYGANTGVTIGSKKFTAAQIQSIVNGKDLYVLPQLNPDGRHFSMTANPDWRKNRRPAPPGHTDPDCVGVDLNRNFDFLWDFPKYFDPKAPVQNSSDPCDPEVYIGPGAISEPETKNAVWLLDSAPNIRYFIDLHSYSEDILYSWGDDVDQTKTPSMNFQNPAFDGTRGIANDTAYKEYIDPSDKAEAVKLARRMRAAIKAVRGRSYTVMQSLSLYPTAGTSDDYAFSRHFVDQSKGKVFGYTIEWGRETNPTPFHPPYKEMRQIIQEVTAGLFDFCGRAGT